MPVSKKTTPQKAVKKVEKKKITVKNEKPIVKTKMVVVGITTKNVWDQIINGGFLNEFPGSTFTPESDSLLQMGEVAIKSEFKESFDQFRNQVIGSNGSFPIMQKNKK